ncbi:uncharacterized protein LOC143185735 [Calliopsis andreniformis]|uniref:uncharacterized protein LOC143185735 n=1 Tax=Calliopsis andreniformis TaxID=337506 RepID=UPI003FCE0B1A
MRTEVDLEDSLSYLSEELDALGIETVTINNDHTPTETLRDVSSNLVAASWKLIHKYRAQIRKYDQLNDLRCKTLNDNRILKSRVETLSKDLQRQQHSLSQVLEKERRARVEVERLGHEVKRLNNETIKLRKQLQSEKDQHQHQLRHVVQNEEKQRERLERSLGIQRIKKDGNVQGNSQEEKPNVYEKTICRLEENNSAMLREICCLREALSLCSTEENTREDETFLPT